MTQFQRASVILVALLDGKIITARWIEAETGCSFRTAKEYILRLECLIGDRLKKTSKQNEPTRYRLVGHISHRMNALRAAFPSF